MLKLFVRLTCMEVPDFFRLWLNQHIDELQRAHSLHCFGTFIICILYVSLSSLLLLFYNNLFQLMCLWNEIRVHATYAVSNVYSWTDNGCIIFHRTKNRNGCPLLFQHRIFLYKIFFFLLLCHKLFYIRGIILIIFNFLM